MDGLPVTLIVKAPNQQIEDQTIKCKPTWTIHELKGHLSEVYPCKPKKEEQKLIYSGQLLTDSVILKDVLRRYEGQDTHTVHLVCAVPQTRYKSTKRDPTNTSAMSSDNQEGASSNDGVRRRNVASESTPSNQQPVEAAVDQTTTAHQNYWQSQSQGDPWRNMMHQWGGYNYGGAAMNSTPMPVNNDPVAFAAAQMAWMQHMQAQYMHFYTQMMQNGGPGAANQIQTFPPNQQVLQPNPENNAINNNNNNNDNQEGVLPAAVNNNPGNEVDNWDWLDWFYMGSRISIMFAIIYFYSSPARFVIVLVTGFLIYLYQIRYFHGLLQNNNMDNANNNNQPPAVNNNNLDNGQGNNPAPIDDVAVPDAAVVDDQQQQQQEPTNNQNNVQDVAQPSYLSIAWTVFTSFLSSLLPDAPNAI